MIFRGFTLPTSFCTVYMLNNRTTKDTNDTNVSDNRIYRKALWIRRKWLPVRTVLFLVERAWTKETDTPADVWMDFWGTDVKLLFDDVPCLILVVIMLSVLKCPQVSAKKHKSSLQLLFFWKKDLTWWREKAQKLISVKCACMHFNLK